MHCSGCSHISSVRLKQIPLNNGKGVNDMNAGMIAHVEYDNHPSKSKARSFIFCSFGRVA